MHWVGFTNNYGFKFHVVRNKKKSLPPFSGNHGFFSVFLNWESLDMDFRIEAEANTKTLILVFTVPCLQLNFFVWFGAYGCNCCSRTKRNKLSFYSFQCWELIFFLLFPLYWNPLNPSNSRCIWTIIKKASLVETHFFGIMPPKRFYIRFSPFPLALGPS